MSWELIEFPLFLSTMPPPMDAPWNYDENGEALDAGTKQTFQERKEYVEMVKKAEVAPKIDDKLSANLDNSDLQNLASAMKLFFDPGKMGFYDNVLEPFRLKRDQSRLELCSHSRPAPVTISIFHLPR